MSHFLIILFVALLSSLVEAYVNDHSFSGPFTEFTPSGKRQIRNSWKSGGSAQIKENFIRLTPDLPDNTGWIFDSDPIDFEEFSAQIKFRVSGQGKNLFGDGFGFWVADSPLRNSLQHGNLMGRKPKFYGFGILFDTFKNKENRQYHKDISLVVNDHSLLSDRDFGAINRPGCNSRYRLYEGKDSFSADQYSVVQVEFKNNRITVLFDKNGDGNFMTCFKYELERNKDLPSLKPGWMKEQRLHFAFTSMTGSLADNHDILEFIVSKPRDLQESIESFENDRHGKLNDLMDDFDVSEDVTADISVLVDQIKTLAEEVKNLKESLSSSQHQSEFDLARVEKHLKGMIDGVTSAEKSDEKRIAELEKKTKDLIGDAVNDRITALEVKMQGGIQKSVSVMQKDITKRVGEAQDAVGGWKIPFAVIFLLVAVYFVWNFMFVQKLSRRDKII